MTAKDFVKKFAIHSDYGKVFVSGRPKGARSMVNVEVIQRGEGWDWFLYTEGVGRYGGK